MANRERGLPLAAALVVAVVPFALAAQAPNRPPVGDGLSPSAEPYAPGDHWSREALRRLGAMGLVELGDAAAGWPVGRSRVRELLREAAAAEREGEGVEIASRFLSRYEREYPEPERGARAGWSARVQAGGEARSATLRGGSHDWVEGVGWVYAGPVGVPEASGTLLRPALDLRLGSRGSVSAGIRASGTGIRAEEVYATWEGAGFRIWGGRRRLATGPGGGSPTVVLSGDVPFQGLGLDTVEGLGLPSFLGLLGPLHVSTLLSRLERSGSVRRPWFWAVRVGIAPASGVALGFNRASIFGGEGNGPMTFRNVGLMLLGFTETGSKSSDFENQVASVDILWRLRIADTPLLAHGEWGFADVGGAWFRVPGIVAGVEVPSIPSFPALAVGLEHASFSGSGRGHPPWYRHGPLGEGWTDRGRLLGHPLGGHGDEWAMRIVLDPAAGEGSLSGRLFHRHRRQENLLAPDRIGSSTGAALGLRAHGPGRVRLDGGAEWEVGRNGWRQWRAHAGATFFF